MREQKFNGLIITIIILLSILSLAPVLDVVKPVRNDGVRENQYFSLMDDSFDLTDPEIDLLDENEFIVLNRLGTDDILDAFAYYWDMDLPIIITTDMILHVWHLIFDKTLASAEEAILAPLFLEWLHAMRDELRLSLSDLEHETATQHSLIYLNVAIKLLEPEENVAPDSVKIVVDAILEVIYQEPSIETAISLLNTSPGNRFVDDFSQYRPRGHYTKSDILMNYFRAFKWLSRIPFFYDDYLGFEILQTSPEDMIRSSVYLSYAMKNSEINSATLGIEADGFTIWNYLKIFTDLLVGQAYAVDPPTIYSKVSELLQIQDWTPSQITNDHILAIKNLILTDPNIPETYDPFVIDARLIECGTIMVSEGKTSCSPKTMVMFGERLGKDTFALNQYVHPLGSQKFPNGLNFASSILNSEHAKTLLINSFPEYDYQQKFANVDNELSAWPGNSEETLGSAWFSSLEELTKPQPDFNYQGVPNVPNFMQSSKWLDQKLTTVLGSWAQFRHDTILYSKTSIDTPICDCPEGYVEPYPMFFNDLRQTSVLFSNSISELSNLGFNKDTWKIVNDDHGFLGDITYFTLLENFSSTLEILESIAITELLGLELSDYEKDFLRSTYKINKIDQVCAIVENQAGWLPSLLGMLTNGVSYPHMFQRSPNTKASLIADIFTSNNYGQTVEVGTGFLEHMIVEVPGWDETSILAVGPVFSYYEFLVPIDNRMTDEEWQGIIYENAARDKEELELFRGFWTDSYMISTTATQSHLYELGKITNPPEWYDDNYLDNIYPNYPISQSDREHYSILYTAETVGSTAPLPSKQEGGHTSERDKTYLSYPIFIMTALIGIVLWNRKIRYMK